MTFPKFYLVAGPEGSTNRLTARLLIAGGAAGSGSYVQPWDDPDNINQLAIPLGSLGHPLVLIRSVPHNGAWPQLATICTRAEARGYQPHLVVPIRHKHAIAKSQAARFDHPVNVEKQYQWIMHNALLGHVPFTFAVFESFVLSGLPAVNAFLLDLGLQAINQLPEPLLDVNKKYFADAVGQTAGSAETDSRDIGDS